MNPCRRIAPPCPGPGPVGASLLAKECSRRARFASKLAPTGSVATNALEPPACAR